MVPFETTCNTKNRACGLRSRVRGGSKQRNLLEQCATLRTRFVGEVHMSSGWFEATEPFRTTLHAKNSCG